MPNRDIKPEGYVPRIVDAQVERYLSTFGAVEITGTKWCGKTWTALQHGASVSYVDEDFDVIAESPSLVLAGDKPHVIDEWQLVPRIWDVVRHEIDRVRGLHGGWILTGSSTPLPKRRKSDKDNLPKHSGAGRFGRVRMYPMTLSESGESNGAVSLRGLFDGKFEECKVDPDPTALLNVVCRGGWPETIGMEVERAQTVAREYLRALYEESVPSQGLNGDTARRLVESLVRNLGQSATYKTIIGDMFGTEDSPESFITDETVASYINLLKHMYLIEEIRGWEPASRSKKRLVTKPKRYLADPSLAVAQLGMSPDSLLHDWQTFGLLFENLCIRDLLVYARSLTDVGFEPVRYYRDDSGLEIDAIVELADGRWAAFEVKTGETKVPDAVASLKRLRRKVVSDNPKARVRPPEFMAVITGTGQYSREIESGIFVIPIRALGA